MRDRKKSRTELRNCIKICRKISSKLQKTNGKSRLYARFSRGYGGKINEDGLVVKMPQGSYTIERAHPLLQPYNAMVKNYNATLKQLNDLLPNADAEAAGQALMMFATKPSRAAKSG